MTTKLSCEFPVGVCPSIPWIHPERDPESRHDAYGFPRYSKFENFTYPENLKHVDAVTMMTDTYRWVVSR